MKRIVTFLFAAITLSSSGAGLFTQAEVDEQLAGVYAELYTYEGVTPQTITNSTSVYTKCTGFASVGETNGCSADLANNQITITKAGIYKVECSLSFTGTGVNNNWFGAIFVDGAEQDQIHFERKISTGGDYGSTQFAGYVNVASVPIHVDLRLRQEDTVVRDATVRYANFNVKRIGL